MKKKQRLIFFSLTHEHMNKEMKRLQYEHLHNQTTKLQNEYFKTTSLLLESNKWTQFDDDSFNDNRIRYKTVYSRSTDFAYESSQK